MPPVFDNIIPFSTATGAAVQWLDVVPSPSDLYIHYILSSKNSLANDFN
jgi:hypothetical protein